MTDQTQRLEKALHGCAERGISPTPEPWAEIEGRLEARAAAPARRPRRFVPKTRTGLALAAALVVLFGMGAYAASGLVYEEFRLQLPGARGPVYGEQLGLVQTAHGVKVSLEWAYADSRYVVVAYTIEDLEDDRRVAGHPAELGAVLVGEGGPGDDARRFAERFPNRVVLADESGTYFAGTGGQSTGSGTLQPLGETTASGVFAPEKAIEPGEHEFRLEIPVVAQALPSMSPSEPVGEPFVFDFKVPVRPAPTIELGQTVEANGVALTLERVVNSPARPEAEICYGSPDTRYDWNIYGDTWNGSAGFGGGPMIGQKRACTTILLPASLEGHSEVAAEKLEGVPDCPPGDNDGCSIPQSRVRTIEGPWTFEVTAPER